MQSLQSISRPLHVYYYQMYILISFVINFLRKSNATFTHLLEPAERLFNLEGSASLLLDLLKTDTLSNLNQLQTTTVFAGSVNIEDSEIGNNPANDRDTSQGELARLDNLGSAMLVGVCGDDNDLGLVRIGNKVHGATHTLDKLAGNHEVGEITVGGNFHGTENGYVDVATSDHTEGLGGVKNGSTRNEGDGFFTGVDDVGVYLLFSGVRAHTQDTVLTLDPDLHTIWQVVSRQDGDANTQVDIGTIVKLLARSLSNLLTLSLASALTDRSLLTRRGGDILVLLSSGEDFDFLVLGGGDNSVDKNTGEIDLHRVELADLDNVLGLDNRELGSSGDKGTKSSGSVPEDTVTGFVDLPSSENGDITVNGRLEEELLAVKHLSVLLHTRDSDSLLAIGTRFGPLLGDTAGLDMGTGTSPSEETGHTSTSSSKSLGNGTLGTELDLDFTGKVSILEALVGTEIGQDHFLDLFRSDKGRETVGTSVTSVVGDDSQVLQVTLPHSLDDSFGSTTETKTSGQNSLTVLNVSDSSLCVRPDLRLFAGSDTRSAMSALRGDRFEV